MREPTFTSTAVDVVRLKRVRFHKARLKFDAVAGAAERARA